MKIKIVYDNEAMPGFRAAWGFSCFIKHNINLLFDTGWKYSVLKHNMEMLGISLDEIDAIFISHNHYDHAGGLRKLKFLPNFISSGEINGEQSLIVRNKGKLIIFTGCSHNGLLNVIKIAEKYGEIYGIIGGFHNFKEINLLRKYELIMPCHCTKLKKQIEFFPNAIKCMSGKVVEI